MHKTKTEKTLTSKHIIANAVERMKSIFLFHMTVMLFLTSIQICFGFRTILPISFIVFCNTLCLAERFWHVQLVTLIYWPIETRGVFVASRLLIVTVAILTVLFCVKIITCQ